MCKSCSCKEVEKFGDFIDKTSHLTLYLMITGIFILLIIIEDKWYSELCTELFLIFVVIISACIILVFKHIDKEVERWDVFKEHILNNTTLPKHHSDRNKHFDIIERFMKELYKDSDYKKIKDIIAKFDNISFEVNTPMFKTDDIRICMIVDEKIFCYFQLNEQNNIEKFSLSKDHHLYEDYNEMLYNN